MASVSNGRERVKCLAGVSSVRERVPSLAGVSSRRERYLASHSFQVEGKG